MNLIIQYIRKNIKYFQFINNSINKYNIYIDIDNVYR